MNFSKKNHKLVDQNESELRKPQKHDAKLKKLTIEIYGKQEAKEVSVLHTLLILFKVQY